MSYSATLKTARYNQTNWTENPNQARQGRYSDTTRWIGALTFADIRNVDWADQDISQITLTLRFINVGRDEQKNIGLYWHNTDNISGNSKYLYNADRFIGSFDTNGKAYANITTNTFTANDNNPAVFNGIVAWLKNQTTKTLVIYKGDDVDGSYSKNYLSISAASMDITYSPSGSGGTLNKDSVEAGTEITMTITALIASRRR